MVNVKLTVEEPIPVVPFDVLTVHFYLGAAEAIPLASPLHLEYPEPAVLEVEVRVPRGKRLVWVAVQFLFLLFSFELCRGKRGYCGYGLEQRLAIFF